MVSNLRIMTWNSNGLLQRKESLHVTLINQKIDVCLISDRHFTRKSYLKLANAPGEEAPSLSKQEFHTTKM
jgi:hypothetical protein